MYVSAAGLNLVHLTLISTEKQFWRTLHKTFRMIYHLVMSALFYILLMMLYSVLNGNVCICCKAEFGSFNSDFSRVTFLRTLHKTFQMIYHLARFADVSTFLHFTYDVIQCFKWRCMYLLQGC